jgi:hypothetical protein
VLAIVIPAQAGIQEIPGLVNFTYSKALWIPDFAGMTVFSWVNFPV